MKSTYERSTALVAATAVGALLLAGCSGGSTEAQAPQELETDPALITGDIRFMTWWAYADQSIVDGFEKAYPNVNVELDFTPIDSYQQKVQSLASSGDLPDVFASQTLLPLVQSNQLLDLSEALESDSFDLEGTWGESFVETLLEGSNAGLDELRQNGETWGVPFNAISVANIYNTEIFAEVGIEPADDFDELLNNCRALDAAGYIPMSLTGAVWGEWWPVLAWDQTMREDARDEFAVTNAHFIDGLKIVEEMAAAGCWDDSQVTTDIAGETALFLQQKTAQFISVPENFLASVADGAEFEIGTHVLPALDGIEPNRALGGGNANVIVVNAKSENQSAAIAFAKYLTSEEVQRELAGTQYTIPSIGISLDAASPLMSAFLAATEGGFVASADYMPPFSTSGQTTWSTEILPALILGRITAEEAAASADGLFQ